MCPVRWSKPLDPHRRPQSSAQRSVDPHLLSKSSWNPSLVLAETILVTGDRYERGRLTSESETTVQSAKGE